MQTDTQDLTGVAEIVLDPAAGFGGAPFAASEATGSGADVADVEDDGASVDERYQARLGERLRAVRRAQGLRLQDVETKSDGRFKAVVVGSYERGDRAVSAHKLASIADFYGVPVTELLPDDATTRSAARDTGLRLAVDRLRAQDGDGETTPLLRLVQHVQWLRGDYNGRVLSLRGDDLRTVAIALGVQPDHLGEWLQERDLIAS